MASELDAGKAAITLTLDDAALKAQLQQAAGAVEQLESFDVGKGLGKGLGDLGKMAGLLDGKLGGALGKVGQSLGGLANIGAAFDSMAGGMARAAGKATKLSVALAAISKAGVIAASAFAGYELGQWLAKAIKGYDGVKEELYKLSDEAAKYAKAENEIADKQETQIARLKQLAKATALTNEEREKALKIIRELDAEKDFTVSGGKIQAANGAWQRLQGGADARRMWGQESIVNELQDNLEKLRAKRDAIMKTGLSGEKEKTDLAAVAKEITQTTDQLREAEKKLADMRDKTSVEALKKLMAEEQKAIANRQAIAKLESEAANANLSPLQKQLTQIAERRQKELAALADNGATDEQIAQAEKAFDDLIKLALDAAKKGQEQAARQREIALENLGRNAQRQETISAEKAAIDLAGVSGSGAKAGAIDKLIAQYQTATQAGRGRLSALDARLQKAEPGTEEYKQLEEEYKKELDAFTQNLGRLNELMREKNDIAAGETQRAAQYAKDNGQFFEQMRAQNAINKDAFAVSQFTDAAKQSGNLAALEEYAQAARNAATAAEQAAGVEWQKAMADGRLTEEEEKLLEAMKNHAAEQNAMAQELEQAAEQARIDGQKAGGAGGGFDAQAVIAKAMAAAMRNDKALGYQKDTAQGVKKLVELEQKRRDAVLTFTK